MSVNASPFGPKPQFMLSTGLPAVGYQLFFYVAGSVSTKQNTYTDSTGGSANTNPIVLNSLGEPTTQIWFTAGQLYKAVLAPANDTDPPTSPVWTIDNLRGINDTTTSLDEWTSSGVTPTYVSATQFTLAGDQTTEFHVGRRVKCTVTAGTSYGTITVSAFGALTTVTVTTTGSNPLDSGLTAVSLGVMRAVNTSWPQIAVAGAGIAIAWSNGKPTISISTSSSARSSNTILAAADKGTVISATTTFTQTLTAAATLADGWYCEYRNDGTGIITIDPNGAETIDGLTTINLYTGESCIITCNGTSFKTIGRSTGNVLIGTSAASASASIVFTTGIDSTFDAYELEFDSVIMATNGAIPWMRVSKDGGATYISAAASYRWAKWAVLDSAASGGEGSTGDVKMALTGTNGGTNNTGRPISGRVRFYAPSSAAVLKNFGWDVDLFDGTNYFRLVGVGAYVTDVGAINAIQFLMSSGNITSGNFRLYGLRKS